MSTKSMMARIGELSERELLLLMIEKFDNLEENVNRLAKSIDAKANENNDRLKKLEDDMNTIKTKFAIYAAIIGSAVSALGTFLFNYLKL